MTKRAYLLTVGVVYLLIALAHAVRLALGAEWIVEGRVIPMWPSWLALFLAGYLSYEGFRLSCKLPL